MYGINKSLPIPPSTQTILGLPVNETVSEMCAYMKERGERSMSFLDPLLEKEKSIPLSSVEIWQRTYPRKLRYKLPLCFHQHPLPLHFQLVTRINFYNNKAFYC